MILTRNDPGRINVAATSCCFFAIKVESLRITFAQWHTELKPERQAAILKETFGGAVEGRPRIAPS